MSALAVASPPWLYPGLPCWRQPRPGHGLLAIVGPAADTSWADEILAGDDTERLVWMATGPQPERAGLVAAQRPGVRAVCLAPAGRDLRRIRAAIQLAHRLADTRGDDAASARAHLTSADPPATVDRSIRIPHLISMRYGTGNVADAVMWELMPRVAAPDWSRVPPATQGFIETNLRGLLALRGAARAGQLPQTTAGQRLNDLLAGRPLIIRAVYRHLDLIRPLLSGQPVLQRGRPPVSLSPAQPSPAPTRRTTANDD